MQSADRELLAPGMRWVAAGIVFFLVAQYTLLGSLGTGGMEWARRLAFWAFVGALQFPCCYGAFMLTLCGVRGQQLHVLVLAQVALVLVLSASCTAMVFAIYGVFEGGRVPGVSLAKVYGACALNLSCSMALLNHVLWLRLGIKRRPASEARPASARSVSDSDDIARTGTPLRAQGTPSDGINENTAPPGPTRAEAEGGGDDGHPDKLAPDIRLFDRLPEELGRDVIYLKASAHYVEVITVDGSGTTLARFTDAVAELGSLGIRIHRSYWVAHRHVQQVDRRGEGRIFLRLTGDHEVPIGRSYLPDVRAAMPKSAWLRARRRSVRSSPPSWPGSL